MITEQQSPQKALAQHHVDQQLEVYLHPVLEHPIFSLQLPARTDCL
jgi:hypothetical protein